jgi:hypothetical protein
MPPLDLSKTHELRELFAVPREVRDAAWRRRFWAAVPDASLVSFQPQIERGPDGFPYFQLAIPPGGAFTAFSLSHVLPYVLEHGLGAVVFADASRANPPEWVFSFGALLSLQMFGTLDTEGTQDAALADGAVVSEKVETPRQIFSGVPSEEFLPASARRALGRYLREAGIADPGVALIVDPTFRPQQNLLFNVGPENFGGDEARFRAFMSRLRWFLPEPLGLISGITAAHYAPLGGS